MQYISSNIAIRNGKMTEANPDVNAIIRGSGSIENEEVLEVDGKQCIYINGLSKFLTWTQNVTPPPQFDKYYILLICRLIENYQNKVLSLSNTSVSSNSDPFAIGFVDGRSIPSVKIAGSRDFGQPPTSSYPSSYNSTNWNTYECIVNKKNVIYKLNGQLIANMTFDGYKETYLASATSMIFNWSHPTYYGANYSCGYLNRFLAIGGFSGDKPNGFIFTNFKTAGE